MGNHQVRLQAAETGPRSTPSMASTSGRPFSSFSSTLCYLPFCLSSTSLTSTSSLSSSTASCPSARPGSPPASPALSRPLSALCLFFASAHFLPPPSPSLRRRQRMVNSVNDWSTVKARPRPRLRPRHTVKRGGDPDEKRR
ncbi:hypothetical protein GBA52_013907 [Prunus armeniaca]|nr:hypothetical protein GBA52_013907 [Prunus armeniaca]